MNTVDSPPILTLPPEVAQRVDRIASRGYPFEVCGVLLGRRSERAVRVARAIRIPNITAERRRDRFVMDPRGYLRVDRVARRLGLDVVGVWHSHPDSAARPSETDAEWSWPATSYLIVSVGASGVIQRRSWEVAGNAPGFIEQPIASRPGVIAEPEPIGAKRP